MSPNTIRVWKHRGQIPDKYFGGKDYHAPEYAYSQQSMEHIASMLDGDFFTSIIAHLCNIGYAKKAIHVEYAVSAAFERVLKKSTIYNIPNRYALKALTLRISKSILEGKTKVM